MVYDRINLAGFEDMIDLETWLSENPNVLDDVVAAGFKCRKGCVAVLMCNMEKKGGVYLPPSGRLGADTGIVVDSGVPGVSEGEWVACWFESGFNQYEKDGLIVRVYGSVEPWDESILLILDDSGAGGHIPIDGWRWVQRVPSKQYSQLEVLEPMYDSVCIDVETGDMYVHATNDDSEIVGFEFCDDWGLGPMDAMIREDDILAEYE